MPQRQCSTKTLSLWVWAIVSSIWIRDLWCRTVMRLEVPSKWTTLKCRIWLAFIIKTCIKYSNPIQAIPLRQPQTVKQPRITWVSRLSLFINLKTTTHIIRMCRDPRYSSQVWLWDHLHSCRKLNHRWTKITKWQQLSLNKNLILASSTLMGRRHQGNQFSL